MMSRDNSSVSTSSAPTTFPYSRPFYWLVDAINRTIYYAIATLLAGMFICSLMQVLVRLVLDVFGINLSVPWSEELSRYFMIWLIFLGAGYGCRQAQLISLTILIARVPAKLHRVADALVALVCIGFYALLVKVGFDAMKFGWIEKSPVLQIPKAYIYLAMPVGATVMALNTIALLAERGMFGRSYQRPTGDETGSGAD